MLLYMYIISVGHISIDILQFSLIEDTTNWLIKCK